MLSTAFIDLPPLQSAAGEVTLPGSKSISNRVLLLAALCSGRTTIHDLLDSDDTQVMLGALRALGCGLEVTGNTVTVQGMGGQPVNRQAKLFMGNAGTAIRPLTAALAVMGGEFELRGVPRMHERPIGDLVDALRQLGCQIDYLENPGYPPLHIGAPQLRLDAPIQVRGDVSSQFLTALLMALPLVAKQGVVIEVTGELISRPYIEITLNLLARFNVHVKREAWQRFTIPAGSKLLSPGEVHVEADASSASYFIALGAISTGASGQKSIKVLGVGADSIQGDIRFIDAAQLMGAKVQSGPNWLKVSQGAWPLKAIDLDCNHIPDAAMTLAVMALYADGTTILRNIASWRVKEPTALPPSCATSRAGASRKPTALPPWPVSCASLAPPWSKAQISFKSHHQEPRLIGVRQASTLTTITAWPCVFRWPHSTRRVCRCALKTPSAWPKPSRITSRRFFRWRKLTLALFR